MSRQITSMPKPGPGTRRPGCGGSAAACQFL